MKERRDGSALALISAVGIDIAIAALDSWHDDTVIFIGFLAASPFIASLGAKFKTVVGVSVLTVLIAVALGWADNFFWSGAHLQDVVGVALLSVIASAVTFSRDKQQRALIQVRTVAEKVQHAILRPPPDILNGVRVAVRSGSATAEAEIGGDFYDVIPATSGVTLVVGDVKGSGIDAVYAMTGVISSFREAARRGLSLTQTAAQLNQVITELSEELGNDELFATALLMNIAGGKVSGISCGHMAPWVKRVGASPAEVQIEHGLPLGLGVSSAQFELELGDADTVVSVTDGVTEARDRRGEFFDLGRALQLIDGKTPADTADAIKQGVERHGTGKIADDYSIMVLALDAANVAMPSRRA